MNKKTLFPLILFLILAVAQWLFTGNMIMSHNEILAKGKSFRFQTEPVDPSQPFIGKYIYLNFKENQFITHSIYKERELQKDKNDIASGDEVFAQLTTNKAGFAVIENISKTKPESGDYIKTKCSYSGADSLNHLVVYLQHPFSKFYMEEYKAPKAEQAYAKANGDTTSICYALIKIYNGNAVVENVFINNKPITELANHQ